MAHILLVDDNEFNIYTLRKQLESLKIFVGKFDFAYNGKDAIDKVSEKKCPFCKNNYCLIFMDLNMPVKDGFEATREICEYYS